ncbi:unnamed protein product, partial [Cylicostephanus goldi]
MNIYERANTIHSEAMARSQAFSKKSQVIWAEMSEMNRVHRTPRDYYGSAAAAEELKKGVLHKCSQCTRLHCPSGQAGKEGPPGLDGEPGLPGRPGAPGKDGEDIEIPVSVSNFLDVNVKETNLVPIILYKPDLPCSICPAGPQGPRGPQGERGMTGRAGTKGSSGHPGNPGLAGLVGTPGYTGYPGAPGNRGIRGPP